MRIFIKYEGVLDHLDILSEESKKCSQLLDSLKLLSNEIALCNPEQEMYVKSIIREVEEFRERISRRRDMILEIVTILKNAKIKTDTIISEIGQIVETVNDGGLDG